MRPTTIVLALTLALALPGGAASAPISKSYVGPGDAGLVSTSNPDVNVGGARFVLPAGSTSASVVLVDDLGFQLDIVVCQDPSDNPALCRNGVSPVWTHACETATVAVNPALNLFVFALTALDDVNGCSGFAPVTSGTITVTPS